jgi:hypothetical protein
MSPETRNPQKPFNFFPALLISFAILILWLIPDLIILLHGGKGGPGVWGLFTFVAIPATVIVPLAYGWYTKDTTGAVLIGLLPFLLTMIIVRLWPGSSVEDTSYLVKSVLYIGSLCVVGGLEGYFAAMHEKRSLVLAAAFAGLWALVFLSGIN